MKILHAYVARSFLVVLLMTLLVLTFVMSIGAIFRVIDLLAKGISGRFLLRLFLYGMPEALTFSVPVSILTALLLVFGRLASDGEVTATRACGVSLWQLATPALVLAALLSVFCLWVNHHLSPWAKYQRRILFRDISFEEPIKLIEPGCWIRDFPGLILWMDEKHGNALVGITIYKIEPDGNVIKIRARSGELQVSENRRAINVTLHGVQYSQSQKEPRTMYTERYDYPDTITMEDVPQDAMPEKTPSDMGLTELLTRIFGAESFYASLSPDDRSVQVTLLEVELNKRFALALSCLAFAMLGIPLAVKAHRRESTIGIGISLFLAFAFYLFIILADSMARYPAWQPESIVWVPVVLALALGGGMLHFSD